MASSYSPLKVELIGTGEQAGTWGTTTNVNLGTTLEEAITGRATATFPSDANYTLPYTDSNASQVFRNLVLNVTSSGNLSTTRDLIIPAIEKQYFVENNTSGSQSIRIKTAAGTGVTIPAGRVANVYCNGTDTRLADDFVDINGGAIDGTPIGSSSASTGSFSTLAATTGTINTATISGGTINSTSVGASFPSTGAFTTLTATTGNITTGTISTATISGGTINNTSVGATTPSSGAFSTLTATSGTLSTATISGGTINGTSVGASTPSTGAFTTLSATTATVDTANITTANITNYNISTATITTANITTGNINTLTVGTQTNKATISYTTNAARTLTIPAVSGNRTFAFLEEAQTFTANQTIAANLIFSGNARRIQGQFDNYDNNATIFQDSATNGDTTINIAPNGSGGASALHCHSNSDLTNSIVGALNIDNNEVSLFSLYTGANSYQPLNLVNGGAIYVQVNSDGTVYMPGVYGSTVGGTNRDLYIDNTGKLGYLTSTRKSKTNIAPIEDTSWLMNLEPVSFNRRVQASGGLYTDQAHKNTEFGLIADDAAQVRPEICFNDDFGNLAGIHYEQLIAPMLKEIQKLRAEVEALKAKG